MTDSWLLDFLMGLLIGILLMVIIFLCASDVIAARAINQYKDGKIDCQVVGDQFICRDSKQ